MPETLTVESRECATHAPWQAVIYWDPVPHWARQDARIYNDRDQVEPHLRNRGTVTFDNDVTITNRCRIYSQWNDLWEMRTNDGFTIAEGGATIPEVITRTVRDRAEQWPERFGCRTVMRRYGGRVCTCGDRYCRLPKTEETDAHHWQRCTIADCEDCYPIPSPDAHQHWINSWNLADDWRLQPWYWYGGQRCRNRLTCTGCYPGWSLTLAELSARRQHELAERRERERYERVCRFRDEVQERANWRAKALLQSLLTEEQKREYDEYQHFTVTGSLGGVYRINRGYSGNVDVVQRHGYTEWHRNDYSYHTDSKCAHPQMYGYAELPDGLGRVDVIMPYEDAMVAQMLRIQANELAFLDIANNF